MSTQNLGGPFSNLVYMRGVASGGDGNHSGPLPSVGTYLDEQPITTALADAASAIGAAATAQSTANSANTSISTHAGSTNGHPLATGGADGLLAAAGFTKLASLAAGQASTVGRVTVDAVLEARVMRLGRTLAFCTTEIREAGSDKPAAFATGTYAIL